MKILATGKDGGPESSVTGYWLVEIKWLFSIVVLRFDGASRDAYHDHAFNSISWLLRGRLVETMLNGRVITYRPSLWPIVTCGPLITESIVTACLGFFRFEGLGGPRGQRQGLTGNMFLLMGGSRYEQAGRDFRTHRNAS